MKQRTKIIFGVAILIAIVSMNIRHAWMNYGIVKDKIAAGVLAEPEETNDTTVIAPVICPPKPGFSSGIANKKEAEPIDVGLECVTEEIKYYYIIKNGGEKVIATARTNHKENKTYLDVEKGWESSYFGQYVKDGPQTREILYSKRIICDKGTYPGQCCYPKEAASDCDELLKPKST